jgi:hypothetical protein
MPVKNKLLYIIIGVLLFAIIPFVSSAPPVTTIQQFTEGYIIEGTPQETLKQNNDFTFNFFLYNISNGVTPASTTSCIFYLSNSSGNILFSSTVQDVGGYRSILIKGNNFSKVGHYPYGVKCNSSKLGGALVSYFEVTPNGLELTTGRALVDIGLLIVFVIFLTGIVYIFLETDNLLIKFSSVGFGYLVLIIINFIAWNMANDFLLSAPFIASMFRIFFFVLIVGLFPLVIGGFAYYLIMIFKIKEIERLMGKGMDYNDAERRQGRKYK